MSPYFQTPVQQQVMWNGKWWLPSLGQLGSGVSVSVDGLFALGLVFVLGYYLGSR